MNNGGMVDLVFVEEAQTKNKSRFQELDAKGNVVDKDQAFCDKLYISKKKLAQMGFKEGSGQQIHVQITVESPNA